MDEFLGESEGVPGGQFKLRNAPVVAAEKPLVVEVNEGDEWQQWSERPNFAASGPDDRHFVLDAASGEIAFGPAVRLADGAPAQLRRRAAEGRAPSGCRSTGRAAAAAATSRPARCRC